MRRRAVKKVVSEAQKRAKYKWDAEHKDKVIRKTVMFGQDDFDLLEHLGKQENMSGYIKGLIRRDMEKEK